MFDRFTAMTRQGANPVETAGVSSGPLSSPSAAGRRVAVIGAGASGLVAALFAARAGGRVVLLERNAEPGRKLLLTGGGRCNILPAVSADPRRFVTASSRNTLRNILGSWPLAEVRAFFETQVGLRLVEETGTGKLFPSSQTAKEVRDRLAALALKHGVEIRSAAKVLGLESGPGGSAWTVRLRGRPALETDAVVLATGGLSYGATGSDGWGHERAMALGHTVRDTYPALTPLVTGDARFTGLAGISLDVTLTASVGGKKVVAEGALLFTHRGFSGPAALDISHAATVPRAEGEGRPVIRACWTTLTAARWDTLFRSGRGAVAGLVRGRIPARLADVLIAHAGIEPARPVSQLRRDERRRLVEALTDFLLPWTGHDGYERAEVTGGGVALEEVSPRTLESRLCRGLFFCGEILDAFGPIGGNNLLWAWVTGRLAGTGAAVVHDAH
ncbi:MAG: aminoacetone oxidase family FAD-binding enzyme [Planctomycetota bacterium]|nr:aminoacetone oxidase family FAD-binding enzyme [Planctomycetota bacterium]